MPEEQKEGADLTHMGRTAEERKGAGEPVSDGDTSTQYHYGLRCNLGNEELKKLGVAELPSPGEELEAEVRFKVMGARTEGEGTEARHNVELQITHMNIMSGEEEESEEGDAEEKGKTLFGKPAEEGGEAQ
jgi:hypothetical protein